MKKLLLAILALCQVATNVYSKDHPSKEKLFNEYESRVSYLHKNHINVFPCIWPFYTQADRTKSRAKSVCKDNEGCLNFFVEKFDLNDVKTRNSSLAQLTIAKKYCLDEFNEFDAECAQKIVDDIDSSLANQAPEFR